MPNRRTLLLAGLITTTAASTAFATPVLDARTRLPGAHGRRQTDPAGRAQRQNRRAGVDQPRLPLCAQTLWRQQPAEPAKAATAQGVVWLQVISSAPGEQGHVDGLTALKLNQSARCRDRRAA